MCLSALYVPKTSFRCFSTEYPTLEEPTIAMETQKRDDKVIFHVCHRLSTLKDAIRYFNNERHGLTHQQSSVLLNRFNTLVRHKAFDDKQEAEVAEQCMDSIASHLYGNVD